VGGRAHAGQKDIVLLPVAQQAVSVPVDLGPVAREVGLVLSEAVRDFGLQPVPSDVGSAVSEADLPRLAADSWVLLPELSLAGSELSIRLVVVPPGSKVLRVRQQTVAPEDVEVRLLVMLRELVTASVVSRGSVEAPPLPATPLRRSAPPEASRSSGRAILAMHAAALGGYLGFSLQRASGSNDSRLTYPLAALGAGAGLGSSVIIADEWDISVARAWFLGASMFWPAVGTLLAVEERDLSTDSDQFILGLVGAVGGLTLGTAGLALGDVSEGGAAMTHSGASLGLLLGGLSEMAIQGDAEATPSRGMGVGAIGGVLVAGALATRIESPSATDLLFIDLSALLGGLAGAAVGTPILVSQDRSPTRDRLWISGVMLGTVAGAGLGYWVTEKSRVPAATPSEASSGLLLRAQLGHLGLPLGLSVQGSW
jgi:hypothetical protein